MLNTNIKQQINTARDILVGKIPDPKGQIDQITNALIYKFMDDQDRLAQTLPNGKASFFVGDLKPYAWHKLFDTKLSNQDKANLYIEGIAKLSTAKYLPELFQDIFKDAFLPFRAPDTIAMFLGEINKFDYHHSEDLGNAFEYLLSIMGSQGDAGQFRTPRNIIEFIVDAVDPTKDDSILDPACGTAGFLVEAYKHITKDKKLTPNEVQELAKHIHGVDIDPGMAKIARVNLYLHGFKTPLITEDDTLSDDRLWGKKYDVILANPPFMTPRGGVVPHDKFSVKSTKAEILFTDYIAEHLKLSGRAGIVVPDGVVANSANSYKQMRKILIDDNYLWGVVSLPAGVFNPYSGVKTNILLLDRERASKNKEIIFFKVDNDGFDLGAQRREITKNDLPEALEVLRKWKNNEKTESSKVIYVRKDKIVESEDYSLRIDRYRTVIDYSKAKWPMVELGEVLEYEQPSKYIVQSVNYKDEYPTPVLTAGKTFILGKTNEKEGVFHDGLPIIIFDDFTTATKFVDFSFKVKSSAMKILHAKKEKINIRYAFLTMQNIDFPLSEHKRFWISEYSKIKIPLPPLNIQEQIVAEMDGYAGIIAGAKHIAQNWKPKIDIDPEWEKVKLGEISDRVTKGTTPTTNGFQFQESGINFIKIESIDDGGYFIREKFAHINQECNESLKRSQLKENDILFSIAGALGRVALVNSSVLPANTNQALAIISPKKELDSKYLEQVLRSDLIQNQIFGLKVGVAQSNLSLAQVSGFEIPLPSLEIQKQIVEKIESERTLVESAKKLIEIYEQKTKDAIAKLWEE